jgi:hypothetical protein
LEGLGDLARGGRALGLGCGIATRWQAPYFACIAARQGNRRRQGTRAVRMCTALHFCTAAVPWRGQRSGRQQAAALCNESMLPCTAAWQRLRPGDARFHDSVRLTRQRATEAWSSWQRVQAGRHIAATARTRGRGSLPENQGEEGRREQSAKASVVDRTAELEGAEQQVAAQGSGGLFYCRQNLTTQRCQKSRVHEATTGGQISLIVSPSARFETRRNPTRSCSNSAIATEALTPASKQAA